MDTIRTLVMNPLNQLDTGRVFHRGTELLLRLAAIAWVLVAAKGIFSGVGTWWNQVSAMETMPMMASMVCGVLTLGIALFAVFAVYTIITTRTDAMKASGFHGVLAIPPRLFRMMGEVAAVAPVLIAMSAFVATVTTGTPIGVVEVWGGSGAAVSWMIDMFAPLADLSAWANGSFAMSGWTGMMAYMESVFYGVLGVIGGAGISVLTVAMWYAMAELWDLGLGFLKRRGSMA